MPAARRYLPGTLVSETTWQTRTGWIVVPDALLVGPWPEFDHRSEGYRRPPTDFGPARLAPHRPMRSKHERTRYAARAGIVSRANLLHGLANTIVDHHEPGAAKDRQLRHELMKILLDEHKLDTVFVNITVSDGNVRLWGVVENADEAAAAEGAAKTLPGVKSVENNLGPGPMSGVPV